MVLAAILYRVAVLGTMALLITRTIALNYVIIVLSCAVSTTEAMLPEMEAVI